MRTSHLASSLAITAAIVAAEPKEFTYLSQISPCPQRCADVGSDPAQWTAYGNLFKETALCKSTLLLDFAIHNTAKDPATGLKVLACDTGNGFHGGLDSAPTPKRIKRDENIQDSCDGTDQKADIALKFNSGVTASVPHISAMIAQSGDIAAAAKQLQARLRDPNNCHMTIAFAKSGNAIVGLYVGSAISKKSAADGLIQAFIDRAANGGGIAEFCEAAADYSLGIVANDRGDLASVRQAVSTWSEGGCANADISTGSRQTLPKFTFAVKGQIVLKADNANFPNGPAPGSLNGNATSIASASKGPSTTTLATNSAGTGTTLKDTSTSTSTVPTSTSTVDLAGHNSTSSSLHKRASCTTKKVDGGDSCWSMAQKCGISTQDFDKYNKDTCKTPLQIGQLVCCTAGGLPDLRPKPNADGSCFAYNVIRDDGCDKIAVARGLKSSDIENFNKNTWGWGGCGNLQAEAVICLSSGRPPMPKPIPNAICGPQVPGTKQPKDGVALASLNPCPLKACCNIWGQCGTTKEFCTISKSDTGAPGSSKPGENGCISNCGTNWILDPAPAPNFMKVAYFEAWNSERPCLNMNIELIDKSKYTHVHYSFGGITKDYQVDISRVKGQWESFKALRGVKRILSFGGWSFSTDYDTYPIFRQGVTDANRQTFANSVAKFVNDHGLDGVDFDWEYPGAPDIRGDDGQLPPGSKEDGPNYLKFLKMVRAALPSGKTVSIAAPASYWYLRGFDPIDEFAKVIDYTIYMTYDLHGQWDYNNKWSSPGCPTGNCLRSHVNSTETMNALVMITKAGMPSHKVIVGVTSYGRSFGMTQPGCVTENCLFGGEKSTATKGRCTGTAGYISNFEINEILKNDKSAKTWYDTSSGADIMTYGGNQWVSYMSDKTKETRTSLYQLLHFGGTTDWAVDLQDDVGMYPEIPIDDDDTPDCNGSYDSIDAIDKDKNRIPDVCINQYIIGAISKELQGALNRFNDIMKDGYDEKFGYWEKWIRDQVPGSMFDYMRNGKHVDQFTCEHNKTPPNCCKDCSGGWCGVCDNSPTCDRNKVVKESTPCPGTSEWSNGKDDPGEVWWHAKDEKALEASMLKDDGIQPDWWHYGTNPWGPGIGCGRCFHNWNGYPIVNDAKDIKVPNPKDTIGKSLGNYKDVSSDLAAAALEAQYGFDSANGLDVIDGAEIAVSLALASVDAMEKVADTGAKLEEEERKEKIWGFLMMAMLLIPALGEYAEAVGAAAIGDIIAMVNTGLDVGVGIYSVVTEKENGLLGLFAALLGARGPGAKSHDETFAEAAAIRRGLKSSDFDALPQVVKDRSNKVNGLKKCGL